MPKSKKVSFTTSKVLENSSVKAKPKAKTKTKAKTKSRVRKEEEECVSTELYENNNTNYLSTDPSDRFNASLEFIMVNLYGYGLMFKNDYTELYYDFLKELEINIKFNVDDYSLVLSNLELSDIKSVFRSFKIKKVEFPSYIEVSELWNKDKVKSILLNALKDLYKRSEDKVRMSKMIIKTIEKSLLSMKDYYELRKKQLVCE